MLKIALTGPSGAGKGYVSRVLQKKGIGCLDCDKVVHGIYRDDGFAKVVSEALSSDVRSKDGGIDRALLRPLVFSDKERMARLQALIYPEVRKACRAFLQEEEGKGALAAAVDAPQLFEAGFEGDYDLIVSVIAPLETRICRIMARDGIDRSSALLRIENQLSQEEYIARSHEVVVNDGVTDLEEAMDRLLLKHGVKF
jgi:dephospho-CoA kinase